MDVSLCETNYNEIVYGSSLAVHGRVNLVQKSQCLCFHT